MQLKPKYFLLAFLLLGFTACSEQTVLPHPQPNPTSADTIQELMLNHIDPHADGIWNAVSSAEKQPRTDDEWKAVRQHATALIEAAILLADSARPAAAGTKPEKIQKSIAANPKMFTLYAQQLRVRAEEALAAIEAKNPTAFLEVGGRINASCEQCHKIFWYPNQYQ
ncbi:MAG: hypothetical protein PHE96_09830 [Methylococcales bacterium]|nr:hypothetical protein [Methylococcales bacterium]